MNCLIICGDHPRNYQIINDLLKIDYLNIINVVLHKRDNLMPRPPEDLDDDIKRLWKLHFEKRYISEKKRFTFDINEFLSEKIIPIQTVDEILDPKLLKILQNQKIDICFLSGVPILSEKILKLLPEFTINLHLGIIPHYKGSITMFWPFLFLEPTMAGTTYHIVDKYVDTGEILHNNVPEMKLGDGIHDIASKAVLSASEDIAKVVDHVKYRINKKLLPIKDSSLRFKGKLFLKSDWKPNMLKFIYELFDDKIVDMYLKGLLKCEKPILKKLNKS